MAVSVASLAFGSSLVPAEWKLLGDQEGHPYEVAVDFRITDLRVAANGNTTFVAVGRKGDDEIGFAAKIAKPEKFHESDRIRVGDQAAAVLMQCAIDVTSVGVRTKTLEQLLNTELTRGRQAEEPLRLVGPMNGLCPLGFGHHISETAFYLTTDSGMGYDDAGNLVVAPRFSIVFVIDAPMGRATVYFSRPPNVGGVSGRSSGRFRWFEAQRKKG